MYSPSITLTFFNLALRPQKKDLPFPVSAAFVSANQIFVALPYSTLPSPHALHLNWCLSSSASRSSAMPRPPDRTLTTGYHQTRGCYECSEWNNSFIRHDGNRQDRTQTPIRKEDHLVFSESRAGRP